MKVLVTGASGFCGSAICRKLALTNHRVFGLYYTRGTLLEGFPNVTLLRSDLNNIRELRHFDAVVHTAATSPAPGISTDKIIYDNVLGTRALVEAAQEWGVKAFIFYSSLSIYGEISQPIVDENTPIINPDTYGVTKHLCELMLKESSIPAIALRLPGIVGPKAHRNWQSSLPPKLLANTSVHVYNANSPFNNSVHVDTLADFVIQLLSNPWKGFDTVVLGSSGVITVGEVVERLAKGLGVKPYITESATNKKSFILSSNRAISKWGYKPMEIGALIDCYAKDVCSDKY